MQWVKKKGKKALIQMSQDEKTSIKVKNLSNKIKKKERSIGFFEKNYDYLKKEKTKLEKPLRQTIYIEESKESIIEEDKSDSNPQHSSIPIKSILILISFIINLLPIRIKLSSESDILENFQLDKFNTMALKTPKAKDGMNIENKFLLFIFLNLI